MNLRIATWNMNFWQTRASQESSWRFLDEAVSPDLALLQECVPPPERKRVVYREGGISNSRRWGSAILSYGAELEPITEVKSRHGRSSLPLLATHSGSVAVAEVRFASADPVVVVSAYGVIDEGYAITTVHRILSDLTPLIDSPYGRRLVIGGDLNCSTQLRPPDRARHANLFERVRGLGLVDLLEETRDQREPIRDCICDEAPNCGHVQTHRHPQSTVPWQADYLFASRELAAQLVACHPVDGGDPDPWELSDHCPVVAEFDLQA